MTDSSVRPGRRRGETLSASIAESLRARLEQGEWRPGERLPGEHELAATYGASRATIRTALHALDSRGLTVTVHGVGTFPTEATRAVTADLHRLESISQTITRLGRQPGSTFRAIMVRDATDRECASLSLPSSSQVVSTHREITADGELVAYSHDAIPRDVLSADFDVRAVEGSLFALLERHEIEVRSSLTEIHASRGEDIGWGDDAGNALFVLLEQAHFDVRGRGVAFSRTWFVEGRFQFSLTRVR